MNSPNEDETGNDRAAEIEEHHRYKITAAVNEILRACEEVAAHGTYGFWTPTSPAAYSDTTELITTAHRDILDPLTQAITAAQATIHAIEAEQRDGA
ncbi:hypothetical protein [Streptomyces sp. ST2-7A]|uniref:hypothetical protein n=1 Tax=Streptomyces sp. ST2-7A TaxID=2907214 RepID=UPI001F40B1F7|nr:hypothetical protein [Streptomyces sp. ST2-7A]MCE7079000.1 hypothetical protein [Streptomyces sp. ST2-7A]